MACFRRLGKYLRHGIPAQPKNFSKTPFPVIESCQPIEEEKLPFYEHEQYYPVDVGEVFNSRYQVVGKLGYGAYSTVWLCHDLIYSAMKISTQLRRFPEKRLMELTAYDHLRKVESSHSGASYIRQLWDSFETPGPHGPHQCLIQPPMHLSVLEMMKLNPEPLNAPLLRMILIRLLKVLDFLHTEAGMVHTDLKADNLMLTVEDETMPKDFERAELESPTPRKVIDKTRSIYLSRRFGKPKNHDWGYPILCDFGEARIGTVQRTNMFVQPHIYRAPEVVFEIPWGPPVDIWNLGALIWDLFEGKHMFDHLLGEDNRYDPYKHMAQIAGLLGPPPKEFMPRSKAISQCFDADGQWVAGRYEQIPTATLEDLETRLEGKDKEMFLRFIRSMLKWLPEERKTAKELLDDPWLNISLE